jgi:hypothetical protein
VGSKANTQSSFVSADWYAIKLKTTEAGNAVLAICGELHDSFITTASKSFEDCGW